MTLALVAALALAGGAAARIRVPPAYRARVVARGLNHPTAMAFGPDGRLYAFNRKFFPEWRPRYLCVERLSDLPVVGLAYLHVEQLLMPPGPWARRAHEKQRALLSN